VAPDASIGPSGRKVKCSKCQNVWFASLPPKPKIELSNILPDGKALQGSFNLPIVAEVKISWYLYVMPIILSIMIIITYSLLFPDRVVASNLIEPKLLCQKFAVCDTSGIKLKDVKFEAVDNSDTKKAVLSYKIANNTNDVKNIPIIRVKLLDKDKNVIKSHVASNPGVILKPYHQHLVETRFEDLPGNIENIELSIGNSLELVLR
jgi:hypothetical protein